MSGNCTGWVLRDGPRPTDVDNAGKAYGQRARGYRAVLVTIADAANRDGEHAHPGVAAMTEGSLYGRSQLLAILRVLIAERWITVESEGGGRGKATVYAVNMGRRETVRPPSGSEDGNGPIRDAKPSDLSEKRSDLALETARSRRPDQGKRDANVVPTERPTREATATGVAPVLREGAVAIAKYVWANREPKPATPYIAAVKVLERLLDAGWPAEHVQAAAMTVPTLSIGWLEGALAKGQRPRYGPRADVESQWEGVESGVVKL